MIQESATFFQALLDLVLWILIIFTLRRSYNYPFYLSPLSKRIGIVLILIFCLYAFWGGDYFHYRQAFEEFNSFGYMNQERIYEWFYRKFSFSYTFFRLAIWGLALLILLYAYYRVSPSFDLTLFVFVACSLPIFSYARVSLSMSIIILGISFLVYPGKLSRFFSLIFGLVLLGISVAFHKSAPIGISMAIASLVMTNADRGRIFLIAFAVPLLVLVLQQAFDFFAVMDLDSESYITEHYRNRFIDAETNGRRVFALGPLLNEIITRLPMYLVAVLYIIIVWNGEFQSLTVGERAISSYAFCITLLAVLFSFDFGYSTRVLQYRTLYYALPANAVFLSAVRRCSICPKLFKTVFFLAMFGAFYQLLYATYCALA